MRASISFVHLSRRAAVLMLVLFMATVTYAQITPTDDAYVNTALPTTNYGNAAILGVVSPSQTTYITFDLSSIPAGYTSANLAKASLKLYVNAVTTAGSLNVVFVNGAWAEKTITANLVPALGTTIAASVPVAKASVHDYIVVDVTSAVGAWLDGTQANDGLALVANSPLNASLDSKESTTQSQPPELDIVFNGAIIGITAGSGLTGGGTKGNVTLGLLNTCASGQVLKWNGTTWACSNAGAGTITGVIAGTDLTGGGTSGKVTLNLDITKVPQLGTANVFTGNQTVNGNLSATGTVTAHAGSLGSASLDGSALTATAATSVSNGGYTISATNTGAGFNSAAIYGNFNNSSSAARGFGVRGDNNSPSGFGVTGSDSGGTGCCGASAGVYGFSTRGYGVYGGTNGGLGAALFYVSSNANIIVGVASAGTNVFRVDYTGKGFFDGGTQTGGADFAESVKVSGMPQLYEPGDVLVIDTVANRQLRLASKPYSRMVAGIYSTKPGVLATPHTMDDPSIKSAEVPMAVVGIVPCKVTAANGPIHRGDLLVTSSKRGYAMKGTDRSRLVGAVVGKALEPLHEGTGIIEILVTLQ